MSSLLAATAFATPKRLTIRGTQIYDELGRPIVLRGANVNANDGSVAPATVADEMKNTYKMNCVRLPVEFKYFPYSHPSYDDRTIDENGDLIDLYSYSLDAAGLVVRQPIPNTVPDIVELTQLWVTKLTEQGLWTYLEARLNDCDANAEKAEPNENDGDIYAAGQPPYDTTSLRHTKFLNFWVAIANAFKNTDYIAGYGILAEPSASRVATSSPSNPTPQPVTILTNFQISVMNKISATSGGGAGDTWTPFFVGTDFNYDTLQFRYPDYDAVIAAYPERCIFEVNVLMPKPWIQHGWSKTTPATQIIPPPEWNPCYGATTNPGTPTGTQYTYPQTALANYDDLIAPVVGGPEDWELEKLFNYHRVDANGEMIPGLLNRNFFEWYLQHYAAGFMATNKVPFVLDQFGATTAALGQLSYEKDLIETAEKLGLGWTRWGYNAGSSTRQIKGNAAVETYYGTVGTKIANGEVLGHAALDTGGAGVVRIRAEHVSRQIAAVPDNFRWQLYDEANAIDAVGLRAKAVSSGGTVPADATSPRLDFRVKFPSTLSYPKTFYVWVRMRDGTSSNGVWYGLDGTASSGQLASASPNSWSWVKRHSNNSAAASVSVGSSGFHTFNVWMNKSNVAVDEVLLTTDSSYDPNTASLPSYSVRRIELPNP
ncbi:MAG: hypothetical protein KF715_06190 [Candidatus Didemnitutus sp.]|nr:hypothetical protein [Candidatus Didemnitutus sp.]